MEVNKSFLLGLFFFLAFLGLLDAAYISYTHYAHIIPPCINGGCEIVLRSKYTELVGIPNAVLGIGFYGLIMVFVGVYWKTSQKLIPSLLLIFTFLGLVAGIYLIYLQAVLIHAYCQYCLFSELIDFLLFDCSWWLWRKNSFN